MNTYTAEQVAEHATAESLWIIINGKVYDVTEFQHKHPGKAGPFLHFAGKDASSGFENMHRESEHVKKYMVNFCIGVLV